MTIRPNPLLRAIVLTGLVLATTALTGCAARTAGRPDERTFITANVAFALPRPSELGRNLEAAQLVTARYGGSSYVFEGHLSANPERFLFVGLDGAGREAMRITWTDAGVTSERASWLPPEIRPENMLADLAFIFWPEESVRRAIAGSGGSLLIERDSRRLLVDGQPVVQVEYAGEDPWSGAQKYRNLPWGYSLDILSTETTAR